MYNSTLCYIEDPQGNYLMLHRVKKKNDLNHDKWVGVGGKFEADESPEECVLRETLEETGLTLSDDPERVTFQFVCVQWVWEYFVVVNATGWTGQLIECNEGVLEWIHKDQLMQLPLWAGDKLFLDLIHDPDTPFFSMKLRYEGERLAYAALNGKALIID